MIRDLVALPHPGHPLIAKKMWKVPVRILCNDSRSCSTLLDETIVVIARDAADAANWVRDRIDRPETEIIAYGPKGGRVCRYVGWHSVIGRMMFDRPIEDGNLDF